MVNKTLVLMSKERAVYAGRMKYKQYRCIIKSIIAILKIVPKPVSKGMLMPFLGLYGKAGVICRYLYAVLTFKQIGEVAYIARECVFKNMSRLSVGNNFSLHEFSYIDAFGGIDIGCNVSIAHNCSILSSDHQWGDRKTPIKYNDVSSLPVVIEDDVWIGCGVRILAGSYIEKRVVVAAGAVVTGRLESGYVYAGVPAKKIKLL